MGDFKNQNTVCQPRAPKWRHTVERLKTFFPNWNASCVSDAVTVTASNSRGFASFVGPADNHGL